MRHRKKGKILGREKNQRRALTRSQARSLILHGKIKTTEAKAKNLRPFVEKLVTLSRKGTLASQRLLRARLGDGEAVKKLTGEIASKYKKRAGGYTRIVKLAEGRGDAAKMAFIEFV